MDEIDLKIRASAQHSEKFLKKFSSYSKCIKLTPLQTTKYGRKGIDIWEVKNLSYEVAHGSKPSAAIVRLSERRKRCQDEALADMDLELDEINQEIERRIRYESDELNLKIRRNYNVQETTVTNLRGSEISVLPESEFEESWKSAKNLIMDERDAIRSFHAKLQKLEKERVDKVKVIFRKYYQILDGISYLLPYDLQKLFEDKRQELNCVTLNNLRCYADLQKDLLLHLAKRTMDLKNEIIQHRQSWMLLRLIMPEREGSSRTDGGMPLVNTVSSLDFMKRGDSTFVHITNLLARWQGQSSKPDSELTSNMEVGISLLSSVIQNMLSLYKQALMNMYTGVYDILASLHQDIENTGIYKNDHRLQTVSKKPLLEDVLSTGHMTDVESVSINVMMKLQMELKTLFRFLFDASEPWTCWTKRIEHATCLLKQLIRKTISHNTLMMTGRECDLNILLDALRQESNESKLIQTLNTAIEFLNDITKCYEENFESEKTVIEMLYELGDTQYNLLCIEVLKFQTKNPQEEFKAYHNMEPEPEEKSIYVPQALRLCEAQVETLNKWKYGFWEGIKFALENAKQEVEDTIQEWVDFLQGKALKRLEMKMMLHTPRYDRILTEIFVVRQAEIKFQRERLDMHVQGVHRCLMEMKQMLLELVEKQRNDFKKEKEKLEGMWQENKYSTDITKISNFVFEVEKLAEISCGNVEMLLSQYEEECTCKVAWLYESSHNFLENVKFFSEGGSFSPEMAETMLQELETLNKAVAACSEDVEKQIKSFKVSLPQEMTQETKAVNEEIQLMLTDLKFVDRVVQLVRQCQTAIKTEVFGLKYKGKVLHKQASEMESTESCEEKESVVVKTKSLGPKTSLAASYLESKLKMLQKGPKDNSQVLMMPSKSFQVMFISDQMPEASELSSRFVLSQAPSLMTNQSKGYLQRTRSCELLVSSSIRNLEAMPEQELKSGSKLSAPSKHRREPTKDAFSRRIDCDIIRWNDLLNAILERRMCLIQPATLVSQVMVGKDVEKTKPLGLKYSSRISVGEKKYMAPLVVEKKSFYNYQGMLFGMTEPPPLGSMSFMARVCTLLWDTFSKIQHAAAEYFAMKGSSPIIKTEFIQPTYNKFVEDVLTRFKYYHQQCEEVWIQQVEDFISMVLEVQESVHKYEDRFATEFNELKLERIKKYLGTAASDITDKLKENLRKLETTEKKLMPLHGYPGNRRLLEALTSDAIDTANSLKEDLNSYVKSTKVEFQQEFMKIFEQSKSACGCLERVLGELKTPEILKQLHDQKKLYLDAEEMAKNAPEEKPTSALPKKLPPKSALPKKRPPKADSRKKGKSKGKPPEEPVVAIEPDLDVRLQRTPVPSIHRLSLDSQDLNEQLGDSEIQIPDPKKSTQEGIADQPKSKMSSETVSLKSNGAEIADQPKSKMSAEAVSLKSKGAESTEKTKLESMIFSTNEILSSLQKPEVTLQSETILESTDANVKEHVMLFKDALSTLDAQQSSFETRIQQWLNNWNTNVWKVQQLYSVEWNKCQLKYKQTVNSENKGIGSHQ